MPIRSEAVQWLMSHYGVKGKGIYASKFFEPNESWNKKRVWWFEIPLTAIESNDITELHLLCQVESNKRDFHYLKVPIKYFREQLKKFDVRNDGRVSIYLSAEPHHMFVEERAKSNVSFSRFLQ